VVTKKGRTERNWDFKQEEHFVKERLTSVESKREERKGRKLPFPRRRSMNTRFKMKASFFLGEK